MSGLWGKSNPRRPRDFETVFVQYGWRGIERLFGARTSINVRWIEESGREDLLALRRRYRKGDAMALQEARRLKGI